MKPVTLWATVKATSAVGGLTPSEACGIQYFTAASQSQDLQEYGHFICDTQAETENRVVPERLGKHGGPVKEDQCAPVPGRPQEC